MRAALLVPALLLASCGQGPAMGPDDQTGANPKLPAPREALFPAMTSNTAKTPWKPGEAPIAAKGLRVAAFATGLAHPRTLHVLPNGDVLVVEANGPGEAVRRPKVLVMRLLQAMGKAGTGGLAANRITLLRDADGDGRPELRTVFLDHLNAPHGVALAGHDLYVADTDRLLRFHYIDGANRIAGPGVTVTELPAGAINYHWTRSLIASPDGTKLYVGSAPTPMPGRTASTPSASARRSGKWMPQPARTTFLPAASATRPRWTGNRQARRCGWSSTNATNSAPIWCPIT